MAHLIIFLPLIGFLFCLFAFFFYRKNDIFSDFDKEKQLVHRGLYAEYNLVYDRGTKFGLTTGHDADAVLMSLPPVAKWH